MQLIGYSQTSLVKELKVLATSLSQENIFNVSLRATGETFHATYRARVGDERTFRAFYTTRHRLSDSSQPWTASLDLSELASRVGVAPVADPKLFEAHGSIFATFNTGFRADTDNEIYVVRLAPEAEQIQKCVLEGTRNRVEKNWAFHEAPGGRIAGIYSLNPPTRLVQVSGELGGKDDLVFSKETADELVGDRLGDWSIGTQPLALPGRLLLVAHEKFSLGRRRTYFGRLVELSNEDSETGRVRVSRKRLVHSTRSMLPRRGVHNPNLLSATYFAGISRIDTDILLSYGINDVSFGIARTTEDSLWH